MAAYDEAQPGLRRFFAQLTTYLGLVGLASLLVGGIGVAASVSAFVARQMPTIATLKALGTESRTLVAAYLIQTQAVALAGGVAGAALGVALQPLLAAALAGLVPFALEWHAQPWHAGARGRDGTRGDAAVHVGAAGRRARRPRLADPAPRRGAGGRRGAAALVHARPGRAGPRRAGALAGGLAQDGRHLRRRVPGARCSPWWALARGMMLVARRLPRARGLAWRHGLAALRRPGSHAPRVVVALGMAAMLLVTVALLQSVLGRQIDLEQRRQAAVLLLPRRPAGPARRRSCDW